MRYKADYYAIEGWLEVKWRNFVGKEGYLCFFC